MPHHTPLIATICAGLFIAFVAGAIAHRLKVSPLVGYLLAGVMVGPFTPGFVADQSLANELAEIGVILLMFGVGLHFSLKDLLSVRAIAIPGAVVQMATATLLGVGLAYLLGWTLAAGLVFGLALSVASTVVLLRALQERRLVETEKGRIAVGWLIVEDLAMVLALVLIPAFAGIATSGQADTREVWSVIGLTLGKVVAFGIVMLVIGRRLIPWVLHWVAHTGSRELFRLAVLAIALGVAFGAAKLFGVSFALGAFFAGMILNESPLSHRAAQETLPLRDAFAVLFFVSVGMLFDPSILIRDPLPVLATVAIIVAGKSVAAFVIVRAFRHPTGTALTISASLAQIGEFSFILAGLGVSLAILPERGRDLILAGAIISILANPVVFHLIDMVRERSARRAEADAAAQGAGEAEDPEDVPPPVVEMSGHTVLVGFGRVGSLVGSALRAKDAPLVVIERSDRIVGTLRQQGYTVLPQLDEPAEIVRVANVAQAARLILAVPETFEAGQIVEKARAVNATIPIIARAHSDEEVRYLSGLGATEIVMGEREIARAILDHMGIVEAMPAVPQPKAGQAAPDAPAQGAQEQADPQQDTAATDTPPEAAPSGEPSSPQGNVRPTPDNPPP